MNKPTVKRLKSITNFDILLAARSSGSIRELAQRLQMPLPLLHTRLLVLKQRGVAITYHPAGRAA